MHICIQAKRKTSGHRRGSHDGGFPVARMNYMYLNDSKEHNHPILMMHFVESEGVCAIMGRRKGDGEYVVRRATAIISRLGYMNMILKADQGQSLAEADRIIKDILQNTHEIIARSMNIGAAGQVVVMYSAAGESASTNRIENASQRIQDHFQSHEVGCGDEHECQVACSTSHGRGRSCMLNKRCRCTRSMRRTD